MAGISDYWWYHRVVCLGRSQLTLTRWYFLSLPLGKIPEGHIETFLYYLKLYFSFWMFYRVYLGIIYDDYQFYLHNTKQGFGLKGCTKLTLWKVKFWKCPTHGYKWSQSHSLWTQRNFVKNQVFKMSTTRLQIRHSWPCCG